MSIELELIEQDELLDGLMALTGYNLGLSHQLLDKVIKKTECEVQTTLKEIAKILTGKSAMRDAGHYMP